MFSHLNKLRVSQASTAEYTFYEIQGEPSVIGRPATEANRPYLDAILKNGKSLLRKMRGGRMSVAALKESREQDVRLYPRHVLTGFGVAPIREDGSPAEASDMEAFLKALPDDIFDGMRAFFADPSNFRSDDEELDDSDVEDLAGNS